MTRIRLIISRKLGAFSQRDMVGCEHRSRPLSGSRPQASLSPGIAAQMVEVVGVLLAAGDGQDAGAQDIGQRVDDASRIARVGDLGGQLLGDSDAPLRQSQQHLTDASLKRPAAAMAAFVTVTPLLWPHLLAIAEKLKRVRKLPH